METFCVGEVCSMETFCVGEVCSMETFCGKVCSMETFCFGIFVVLKHFVACLLTLISMSEYNLGMV